jgi:hypothetical protein
MYMLIKHFDFEPVTIIAPEPPPELELVDAYFNNGSPMAKGPGDLFTVTIKLKNNLDLDWGPQSINFGFGQANGEFTFSPIVWGYDFVTDALLPDYCWMYGYWPQASWPIIPPGATKTFQITYGLCPGADTGIYDGCIRIRNSGEDWQALIMPNILTVAWLKPKLDILGAVIRDGAYIGIKYGNYKIYCTLDLTLRNDEGRTLTGDDQNIEITTYRQEDGAQVGFVRLGRVDIPPGTNTLSLTPRVGLGSSDVPLEPGVLNYRIVIKIVLAGWPGKPYVEEEFSGSVMLD